MRAAWLVGRSNSNEGDAGLFAKGQLGQHLASFDNVQTFFENLNVWFSVTSGC